MKRTILEIGFCILLVEGIQAVTIDQFSVFEYAVKGPSTGNPFKEVQFSAEFRLKNRTFFCEGFYDGEGIYKIRFMPDETGEWNYTTQSNVKELNAKTGSFTCRQASENNYVRFCNSAAQAHCA